MKFTATHIPEVIVVDPATFEDSRGFFMETWQKRKFAEAGIDAAEHTAFILNSVLFLMGGFLVFWMAAGFTMLEAGLVRSKNVTMQLTKNVVLFGLAAVFYYLIGYNVMYPLGSWSIGTDETGG